MRTKIPPMDMSTTPKIVLMSAMVETNGDDAFVWRDTRLGWTCFQIEFKWIKHILIYSIYRVTLVVADLGWVDFDSDIPSSSPAAQPVLPNPHWPQQNQADIGTS